MPRRTGFAGGLKCQALPGTSKNASWVRFTVPRQGAAFPADLKQVRDTLASTFSPQEVIFDLDVRAVDGGRLMATWYFAPEEVPDLDTMTLYEKSHKAHREAFVDKRSESQKQ